MQAISQSGTNVKAAELSTKDGTVFSTIVVEVDNRTHLAKVIKTIRKVKGITDVERREGPTPAS
jgi:(p)ppGpp synthase/HD superfamily hydrolase